MLGIGGTRQACPFTAALEYQPGIGGGTYTTTAPSNVQQTINLDDNTAPVVYGTADTSATPNTLALRDSNGRINFGGSASQVILGNGDLSASSNEETPTVLGIRVAGNPMLEIGLADTLAYIPQTSNIHGNFIMATQNRFARQVPFANVKAAIANGNNNEFFMGDGNLSSNGIENVTVTSNRSVYATRTTSIFNVDFNGGSFTLTISNYTNDPPPLGQIITVRNTNYTGTIRTYEGSYNGWVNRVFTSYYKGAMHYRYVGSSIFEFIGGTYFQ